MTELPKSGDLILGKYLLENPIGEGGMGIVYAARHELLGQRVAVKLIRPEHAGHGMSVARFLNEARAAARIESDHVARVLDVGMLDGAMPYMVLEYLDGVDLAGLSKGGCLPVPDVADYLLQAIEGLAHAHAQGIVHRDLKPSNLYLARRPDGTARVKILDFGISKATASPIPGAGEMTRTNDLLGTPLYMSPEQLRSSKSVDHRSDIWALGVVAYELLTGEPPFTAENAVALFAAIQETEPPSLRARRPDLAPELDAVIRRCVQRRPADRFGSVTELAVALAPFATAAGARAFESVKRILPLDTPMRSDDGATSSSPEISVSVLLGTAVAATTPLVQGQPMLTGDPWATSAAKAQPTASRSRGVAIAAVACAAVVVVGSAIVVPRALRSGVHPGTSAVVAGLPPPAATLGAEGGAEGDRARSSGVNAVAPASVASEGGQGDAARTGGAHAVAPAMVSAAPPPAAPDEPTRATKPPIRPATSPRPATSARAPSCKPPYTIDANGDQHWKAECL